MDTIARSSNRGGSRGSMIRGHGRSGQGRGPNHGTSSASGQKTPPRKPKKRDFMNGLNNTPLEIIPIPAVEKDKDVKVSDVTYLGSYSWVDNSVPTLIVPGMQDMMVSSQTHRDNGFIGSPRIWQGPALPLSLKEDSGIHVVDNNGFRIPSSPLLPLFRAVDIVAKTKKGSIDWPSVDFVTDRNNLRKLLRWITSTGGQKKEFRIDMQLAGKRTVLFTRWEQLDTRYAQGGYGYSFEEASTAPEQGCERGTCHDRIIKYVSDCGSILNRKGLQTELK